MHKRLGALVSRRINFLWAQVIDADNPPSDSLSHYHSE